MYDCTGIYPILKVLKYFLTIIQIIAPIIAIVSLIVIFIKIIKSSDIKEMNKYRSNINNILVSLVIIFLIPSLIHLTMYIIGNNTKITSCWNEIDNITLNPKSKYIEKKDNKSKTKKTKVYTDKSEYKGEVTQFYSNASKNCPKEVRRTRTTYNSITLSADTSFSINARQNFENGNWYTTQVAAYDCQNIIVGQHKSYTVNGVLHKNEGGRVAWFDIDTGKNIANVAIGKEGTHMARMAYDSDRDVVLIGSVGTDNLIQIDNKTKQIITSPKYATMTGGGSFFIKYDPYNHQLVGLSRNVISYYKYNPTNNTYQKTSSITLKNTKMWDPQNFNTDGQVIYIANSNPHWGSSNYGVLVYDMKTGTLLENHKLDSNVTGGHIEDVIVDINGNLWLICPATYWRAKNYVAHSFTIGP